MLLLLSLYVYSVVIICCHCMSTVLSLGFLVIGCPMVPLGVRGVIVGGFRLG